jgi:hypothetical protein
MKIIPGVVMSAAIIQNQKIENAVGVIESIDIAVIFTLFLKQSWQLMLEAGLRYPLFLLAAAAKFARMVLAIREAWLSGGERGLVIRAAVEVLTTAAICPAVAFGLFASAALASLAPMMFTATIAVESAYRAVAAVVYWWYSIAPGLEPQERQDYRNKAVGNVIGAVLGGISAVAIFFVMIKLVTIVAAVGLVAAVVGAAQGIYIACRKPSKPVYSELEEEDVDAIEVSVYAQENTVTALMRNGMASPRLVPDSFVESDAYTDVAPLQQNQQPSEQMSNTIIPTQVENRSAKFG